MRSRQGEASMSEDNLPRRRFLLGAGLAGTAIATGLTDPIEAQQQPTAPRVAGSSPPVQELEPFITLTASEAAFIVAAVDTLIPADELSPSGSDCGVAVFIDRQLGSAWGGGSKMYRAGPFVTGKPEQGYQLALTPREYFSAGIAAANAWTRKTYAAKDFDRLAPADRIAALKAMEDGAAAFEHFDARGFFAQLHAITMAGFFADPIYGGNRDKVAWKLLGFPGLPATYADKIDAYRDKRYVADPESIADFS
jgi:gluconate 2-dehydrogenase gamma chain